MSSPGLVRVFGVSVIVLAGCGVSGSRFFPRDMGDGGGAGDGDGGGGGDASVGMGPDGGPRPDLAMGGRGRVGEPCTKDGDCAGSPRNRCFLEGFPDGYCTLTGDCMGAGGCPAGSVCLQSVGGDTFCYQKCVDRGDCRPEYACFMQGACSPACSITGCPQNQTCDMVTGLCKAAGCVGTGSAAGTVAGVTPNIKSATGRFNQLYIADLWTRQVDVWNPPGIEGEYRVVVGVDPWQGPGEYKSPDTAVVLARFSAGAWKSVVQADIVFTTLTRFTEPAMGKCSGRFAGSYMALFPGNQALGGTFDVQINLP